MPKELEEMQCKHGSFDLFFLFDITMRKKKKKKKNSCVSANMLKKIWSVGRRNIFFLFFLFFFLQKRTESDQ